MSRQFPKALFVWMCEKLWMSDKVSKYTVENFCGNWFYYIPTLKVFSSCWTFVSYYNNTHISRWMSFLALYTLATDCQHIFNRCLMIIYRICEMSTSLNNFISVYIRWANRFNFVHMMPTSGFSEYGIDAHHTECRHSWTEERKME